MGQKNLPPKKIKKKNTTLSFIHHPSLSFHQAIPMQTEGNPSQESRDTPISLLLKGKTALCVQALRELRQGRRFPAGSAASAEHGRCQERPLAHSQPGHGADELKYLLNRSIRAGNATCAAWERAAGKELDGPMGGRLDKRTHGQGDGQPGRWISTFPVPPGPVTAKLRSRASRLREKQPRLCNRGERGARLGCHGHPRDRWGPRHRPPPGHRDPRPRLPQRC